MAALILLMIASASGLAAPKRVPAVQVALQRVGGPLASADDGDRRAVLGAAAFAVLGGAAGPAVASVAEPVGSAIGGKVDKVLARKILQIERLNVDSNNSGSRKEFSPKLTFSGSTATATCAHVQEEGNIIQYMWLTNEDTGTIVAAKEFTAKESPSLSASPVKPGSTYVASAYSNIHGLWIGRSEVA